MWAVPSLSSSSLRSLLGTGTQKNFPKVRACGRIIHKLLLLLKIKIMCFCTNAMTGASTAYMHFSKDFLFIIKKYIYMHLIYLLIIYCCLLPSSNYRSKHSLHALCRRERKHLFFSSIRCVYKLNILLN